MAGTRSCQLPDPLHHFGFPAIQIFEEIFLKKLLGLALSTQEQQRKLYVTSILWILSFVITLVNIREIFTSIYSSWQSHHFTGFFG
jgi:p-aminobenzoyl-glutamate transporter AbgT